MLRYALTLTAMPWGHCPQLRKRRLRPQEQLPSDRFEAVAGTLAASASKSVQRGGPRRAGGRFPARRQVAFDEVKQGDWSCRTIRLGGNAGAGGL